MRVLSQLLLLPLAAALVVACGSAAGVSATGTATVTTTGTATTPFSCGTTVCTPDEYCRMYSPGTSTLGGGTYYTCVLYPTSCASSPTCACIQAADPTCHCPPTPVCSEDGEGHFTMNCGCG